MSTTAPSHNAPLYSNVLASPIGLVGVGSLTIRTQIFLPFCETPNVRPIVPSKLPRAPQNHIFKSPNLDEKRGNHTHMRVTNWVTRFVPWDVRSKRRKQKQKTLKKNFKKRRNAASVECFMGLFSPCWLACQKQNRYPFVKKSIPNHLIASFSFCSRTHDYLDLLLLHRRLQLLLPQVVVLRSHPRKNL